MSVDEIIDRERKRAFGFTDDRRCLLSYGDFRRLLMEIEAAAKRERGDKSPRTGQGSEATMREKAEADPNWKEICEKCHDGDIEPYYCEYYGEPNGCNSPIYGKHPKAEQYNAAALREASEQWISFAEWLLENAGKDGLGKAIQENGPIIRQRLEELRAALAAPARPCDTMDWRTAWKKWRAENHPQVPVKYSECYESTTRFMDWYMGTAEDRGTTLRGEEGGKE